MTEHLLSTLGLALKAGAVAVGEEPVGAAARGKKARVIFTAQDAAASSVRRAYSFARAGSCLCLPFPAGKDVLGRSLGRTSVAMCALTDIGFAQSLVRKLAGADPETYGAAADALDIKAKRAHERRSSCGTRRICGRESTAPTAARCRSRPARHRRCLRRRRPPAPCGGSVRRDGVTGYIRSGAAARPRAGGLQRRKPPANGLKMPCR